MLRRLCRPLVLAALCFANTCAVASDWVFVAKSEIGEAWVDKSSIAPKGKYTKAWTIWDYGIPQKLQGIYPPKEYQSTKVLNYYDCAEGTSAIIQSAYYGGRAGTGENVQSWSYDSTKVLFNDFTPDTVGETIHKFVCNNSRNKSTNQRP